MSVPAVSWENKGEKISSDSFKLICKDEMKLSLEIDLQKIPIDEKGIELKLFLREEPFLFSNSNGAFSITANDRTIVIESLTLEGLHYGLNTFWQLFKENNLYCGLIETSPSFEYRGLMLDVSRGKMARIEYLELLIDFISSLSMNVLQLYMEDKHKLEAYPEVGSLYGSYTEKEIRHLDEYAKKRFVELQPNIQTFSHMHGLLRLPEYEDLSENDVLFSLSVEEDATLEFLDEEFEEVLPWYSSKTVNINMDEAYDLGSGKSKKRVDEQGKGEVFFSYLMKVISLAEKHGAKRVQIWGDVVNKYPNLAKNLPENVTVIDWNYNPADSYPSIYATAAVASDVWAAPGVSSWNSLFPRVYNSFQNIRQFSVDAYSAGSSGYLNTDWGDYGHYQMHGLSLFGYMYGAECSWNIHKEENTDWFLKLVENSFFPDKDMRSGFIALMDSNLAENLQTGFKTMSAYAFFDDMFSGLSLIGNERYPAVSRNAFKTLREKGKSAIDYLNNVKSFSDYWPILLGKVFLDELKLSAEMTVYAGDKGELSYRILDAFDKGITSKEILGFIVEIKKLYSRLQKIREEFTRLWIARAKREGMEATLFLFDKAGLQLSKAAIFLAEEREKLLLGVNPSIKDYKDGDSYKVLWTSDFKNMWDRAYPWQ